MSLEIMDVIIIEIKTKNNKRKNFRDGLIFNNKSCDKIQLLIFWQQNDGTKGVFYITVTSQKEIYIHPSFIKCPLKISVNDEVLEKLKPEMEILPDSIVKTEILPK